MARSSWKGIHYNYTYFKRIYRYKLTNKSKNRYIFCRNSSISTIFGENYYIYNGKIFNSLSITDILLNKKFGEFSVTRKPFFFSKKNKKKR